MKLQWLILVPGLLLSSLGWAGSVQAQVQAQVTAAADGTGTIVTPTPDGNQFNVTKGTVAGTNLFHSFKDFSTPGGQAVNFAVPENVTNVLSRVTGGNPSVINGLLSVTGGNQPNLYLMNPAGILFGSGASLNIPGSFLATTANGMRFGANGWFSAVGPNPYGALTGSPNALAFTMANPGAIVNAGNLSVPSGQTVALAGGMVINTGTILTPSGKISIQAVPGQGTVELREEGKVLGFSFNTFGNDSLPVNPLSFTPTALPRLLTGGSSVSLATGISVSTGGSIEYSIELRDSEVPVVYQAGTAILSGKLYAGENQFSEARIAGADILSVSLDITSTDINFTAQNRVDILDFPSNNDNPQQGATLFQANRDLVIQGNKSIFINSQNNPNSILRSGGDTKLISDGLITTNSQFVQGRNFFTQTLLGQPGDISSTSKNTLISSAGDIEFGNYEGLALKVESKGSIKAGNITILRANPDLSSSDSDAKALRESPSIILRAGVQELQNLANIPNVKVGGTNFNVKPTSTSPATIVVGKIVTSALDKGGEVRLSAPSNISTGDIFTEPIRSLIQGQTNNQRSGGLIEINSTSGKIIFGDIATRGGNVSIIGQSINGKNISAGAPVPFFSLTPNYLNLGKVTLQSTLNNIEVESIYSGPGPLNIDASQLFKVTGVEQRISSVVASIAPYVVEAEIRLKNSSELIDFFVKERRVDRKILESSNATIKITRGGAFDGAFDAAFREKGRLFPKFFPASIAVELPGKITIKHGGSESANFKSNNIEIVGKKGGQSGLIIGPTRVEKGNVKFFETFKGDLERFDPSNPQSTITLSRNFESQALSQQPENSSLVAGIIVVGSFSNGLVSDSVQNVAVVSIADKPVVDKPVLDKLVLDKPVLDKPVLTIATGTTGTGTTATGGNTNGSTTTGTTGTTGTTATGSSTATTGSTGTTATGSGTATTGSTGTTATGGGSATSGGTATTATGGGTGTSGTTGTGTTATGSGTATTGSTGTTATGGGSATSGGTATTATGGGTGTTATGGGSATSGGTATTATGGGTGTSGTTGTGTTATGSGSGTAGTATTGATETTATNGGATGGETTGTTRTTGTGAETVDQSPQSNDRQTTQKTPAPCKPANQTGGQKASKAEPCPPAGSNAVIHKLLDEQSATAPQQALPAKKSEEK